MGASKANSRVPPNGGSVVHENNQPKKQWGSYSNMGVGNEKAIESSSVRSAEARERRDLGKEEDNEID